MRNLFFSLVVTLLLAVPTMAQNSAAGQLFGGFSYANIDALGRENGYGFQASYSHSLSDKFSFVADFGGQFASIDSSVPLLGTFSIDFQNYEYLFGPRINQRNGKYNAFAHALVGASQVRTSATTINILGIPIPISSTSETGFALGFGGGFDVDLSERVSFRVVQIDSIPANIAGAWTHNVRVGVGRVFKLGGN